MRIGKGQQEIHLVKIQQYDLDLGTATFSSDGDDIALSSKQMRQAMEGLIASEPFIIRIGATPHHDGTKEYELLQVFQMETKWNNPSMPPYSPTG